MDEAGVQLPPLHPRCRCAILYREVGERSSGARVTSIFNNSNDPFYERRDKSAAEYYDYARGNKEQWIRKIAEHSGMRKASVEKVFEHVFVEKHNLRAGHQQFPPDYDMAESFKRVEDGSGVQLHDRILLRHEWLESGLMRRYNYDYEKAHRTTERKYDYKTALTKWLKERGDW